MPPTVFYRIIRGEEPTVDDFLSARELGKPLLDPRYEREWRVGVSVYNDLNHAVRKARRYAGHLGSSVVRLAVPAGDTLEVRQTTNDPRHFTIYADPVIVYRLVERPSTSIWRA